MCEEKGKNTALFRDRELTFTVRRDVEFELIRQRELYGVQRHPNGTWLPILGEEFGEVCQAIQSGKGWGKVTDAQNLYRELVQVAAVAISWAAQLKEEQQE